MFQTIPNVVGNVQVREQSIVLEYITQGTSLGRHAGPRLAVERDLARTCLQPGDTSQHSRLPCPRRAKENDDGRFAFNAQYNIDVETLEAGLNVGDQFQ